MKLTLLAALVVAASHLSAQITAAPPAGDVVLRAMHDELQRSMKKLQLEQLQRPYFISYRVVEARNQGTSARFGSLMGSYDRQNRFLTVSVRVGDYSLDNSNFFSMPFGNTGVARMFGGTLQLPVDDNYDELRRQIWLATDGAYKKALEDFSGKRAALENKHRSDNTPDFTKGTPTSTIDNQPPVEFDQPAAEQMTRKLSSLFREFPAIQTSVAEVSAANTFERFIDSEGTTLIRRSGLVSLHVSAETQAGDGTPMSDSYRIYRHSMRDLLNETSVEPGVRKMVETLTQRRTAKTLDQYNGPVLFEGTAAAELFARHFAEQLPAQPQVVSDNQQMQAARNQGAGAGSAFRTKIGARVMPHFISVVDNPTANEENGKPLWGGYKADEEGTLARENVVVQNGVLKTLLTSRTPVNGVLQTTGNQRGSGVAPSNLFVNSSKSSSLDDLKKQLMEMVKSRGLEYGIIIRKLSNRNLVRADRVYADGHEEPVRKGSLMDFSSLTFKELAAVSDQRTVYTEAVTPRMSASSFNLMMGQGGPILASYVVPSFLFEDITLHGPTDTVSKPPVLAQPYFENKRPPTP